MRHWDNWQRQYVTRTYDRVRNAYMLIYDRVKPANSTNNGIAGIWDSKFISSMADLANSSEGTDLVQGIVMITIISLPLPPYFSLPYPYPYPSSSSYSYSYSSSNIRNSLEYLQIGVGRECYLLAR